MNRPNEIIPETIQKTTTAGTRRIIGGLLNGTLAKGDKHLDHRIQRKRKDNPKTRTILHAYTIKQYKRHRK